VATVVQRVFVERARRLLKHIHEKQVFGRSRAHCVRMEWQKRGLPHYHVLLFADREDCISHIDKVVSAEMPREDWVSLRGELLEKARSCVLRHMKHRCCFKCERRRADGSVYCKYGFGSNGIIPETFVGDDNRYNMRKREIEDEYIVPYNIELLLLWDGHVNVVPVRDSKSVAYITKYVSKVDQHAETALKTKEKGRKSDSGTTNEEDEVRHYALSRIVGASEATARLLGRSHAVWTLQPPVKTIKLQVGGVQRLRYLTAFNSRAAKALRDSKECVLDDSLTRYFQRPREATDDSDPPFETMKCLDYHSLFLVTTSKPINSAVKAFLRRVSPTDRKSGFLRISVGGVTIFIDQKERAVIARSDSPKSRNVAIARFASTIPQMGEPHWLRRLLLCL